MGEKKGPVFHAKGEFQNVSCADWRFPKTADHKVWTIDELLESERGARVKETLEASELGQFILQVAKQVNPSIIFINDPKMACYGEYIPYEGNLENTRLPMDCPVIAINDNDVDASLLPYILGHELFHMLQDYAGRRNPTKGISSQFDEQQIISSGNRLVPMVRSGIVYNPEYQIKDFPRFFKFFFSMEMACDIFALTLCYLHGEKSNYNNFGEYTQNTHLKPLADAISAAMRYGADQGLSEDERINVALFHASFQGLKEKKNPYYDDHCRWAKDVFDETCADPRFEMVADARGVDIKNTTDFLGFQLSLLPTGFKEFCEKGGVEEHRKKVENHRARRANIGFRVQAAISGSGASGLRFNK